MRLSVGIWSLSQGDALERKQLAPSEFEVETLQKRKLSQIYNVLIYIYINISHVNHNLKNKTKI